jgi:hypothetical protein
MPLYPARRAIQPVPTTLNPTLNHQDTKNTKHTPNISVRTLFVSLSLFGEIPSLFWGATRHSLPNVRPAFWLSAVAFWPLT